MRFFDISKYAIEDAVNLPEVIFPSFVNGTGVLPSTFELLFPHGGMPIWPAMVSMLWSVSGLEMAPLCAEEGENFVENAPRLMKYALLSIFGVLAYVIILVPCTPPGISVLLGANNPIIDGFLASHGIEGLGSKASGVVGEALLNGSLLYAIFAYVSVAFAYLQMRYKYPNLSRPFDLGPIIGPICALVTLASYTAALINMFHNEVFRDTLYICLGKLAWMLLFFVVFQRKHMIETPEEEFIQRYLNGNETDEVEVVVDVAKSESVGGQDAEGDRVGSLPRIEMGHTGTRTSRRSVDAMSDRRSVKRRHDPSRKVDAAEFIKMRRAAFQ
ncbi:UNVERIFIED_CONTAM: hypothetical protein HDU68_007936 [Siphonaria sp. JEL0065]|nr:hypothetical protein HDU68_007936 [Siphonaria sp. JEL0065]